ncbi:MAG: hypothetical protein O6926_07965 [candidate division NC10 bacterium]|nr:hypothetical protein [candidate division NC10 bacterium]
MSRGAQPLIILRDWIKAGIIAELRRRGRPGAAWTLIVLAVHADFLGEAWVSASEISRLTGRKVDSIYDDLPVLQELGAVRRCGREGKRGVNRYRLVAPVTGVTDRNLLPPSEEAVTPLAGVQLPPSREAVTPLRGVQRGFKRIEEVLRGENRGSPSGNRKERKMTREEKIQAVVDFLSRHDPETWPDILVAIPQDRYPLDLIEDAKAKALALQKAK